MNEALLFPGQGAQSCGMGQDWCQAYPKARATFARASAALGWSLEDACWNRGEDIHRTDLAQPGIFTTSACVVEVLIERGLDPRRAPLAAGLSLGEYTALWFAGALAFEDAVRLVALRGRAMQQASEACPSSMTSLMGASEEQARSLTAFASKHGICSVANLNAPGQIIVAGELAALDALEAAAKDHGVKRTRRLVVAGGFHSRCMQPAQAALEEALRTIPIRAPAIPFVTNVTGEQVSDPHQIRRFLAEQVCASVLWEKSMHTALALGVTAFLEPAPGKVLAGLMGKIAPDRSVRSVATPTDLVDATKAN